MKNKQEPVQAAWSHRAQRSWVINAILLPIAISFVCDVIVHWMK